MMEEMERKQKQDPNRSLIVHDSKLNIYVDFIQNRYGIKPKVSTIQENLQKYYNLEELNKRAKNKSLVNENKLMSYGDIAMALLVKDKKLKPVAPIKVVENLNFTEEFADKFLMKKKLSTRSLEQPIKNAK